MVINGIDKMNITELNNDLRAKAIKLNLCQQWQSDWADNKTPQELIEMYKRGIDFGIANQYPSNEYIKANFDRGLLNQNLVFVDEDIDLTDAPSGVYILNGECSGTIHIAPWSVATLYLRHYSNVQIEAGDFARVFIRLYDDSDATVSAAENAIIKVYDRRR